MINKFTISGDLNKRLAYTAIYCGKDISRETCFYELKPKDESIFIRFFAKGNELILKKDGIEHLGNGGTFSQYMFGTNIPFADLIRPNTLNRLVLYGTYHNEKENALAFTHSTEGFETYKDIFRKGNAVNNWFFFLAPKFRTEITEKQRWILKNIGKLLKTSPHVGLVNENSPLILADSLIKGLPEEDLNVFLLCLTDKIGKKYHRNVQALLENRRHVDIEKPLEFDGSYRELDNYTKERIKLDTIYRFGSNRQTIDNYRSLLVEAQKHKSLPQVAQNYIYRYKNYLLKNKIPADICVNLGKKLPIKPEFREVADYIEEFRFIFSNLLFTDYSFTDEMINEDIKTLILIKHRAFLDNNKTFERVLIDLGHKLDEVSDEALKIKAMDIFSKVITYFDLYNICASTLTKVAFGEEEPDPTRIISLTNNMHAFNRLEDRLFSKLFADPLITNKYLTNYGVKKLNLLIFGLEEILKKSKTVSELMDELTSAIEDEIMYKKLTEKIRKLAQGKTISYSSQNERLKIWEKLGKTITLGENRKRRIPDRLLFKVIQDYNLEAIYLAETLPSIILKDEWNLRKDFMVGCGLDILRIEEIEKIYCTRNNLPENYIDSISITKAKA